MMTTASRICGVSPRDIPAGGFVHLHIVTSCSVFFKNCLILRSKSYLLYV